jgi:hypothetical protein
LEYVAEGLEAMYVFGSTGYGDVIGGRVLASGIIRLIVDRAKLARKSRRVMNWTLFGKQCNIAVKEYDSLGESAFRLARRKPKQKRARETNVKPARVSEHERPAQTQVWFDRSQEACLKETRSTLQTKDLLTLTCRRAITLSTSTWMTLATSAKPWTT